MYAILPEILTRLLAYRRRFARLNLPASYALHRNYRKALEISNIELIPHDRLNRLGCVVDVGANLGDWSVAIAQLTTASRIIAFEPVPEIFSKLGESCAPYPQISCRQTALGASTGTVTMNVYPIHQLSSVLVIEDDARRSHMLSDTSQEKRIVVPMTTLDEELDTVDEISILKVDVQGYEPDVFAGAANVLKRTSVLLTEITYAPYYRGDQPFLNLWHHLLSFAPFQLWGGSAPRVSPAGRPMWADAVFVMP